MPETAPGGGKNEPLAPPLRWKVSVRKFSDGERRPLLLTDGGVPHFNSTLFITTQARNAGRMFNTSRAMLDAIRILLIWADALLNGLKSIPTNSIDTVPVQMLMKIAH
jgi:hypothetical protein